MALGDPWGACDSTSKIEIPSQNTFEFCTATFVVDSCFAPPLTMSVFIYILRVAREVYARKAMFKMHVMVSQEMVNSVFVVRSSESRQSTPTASGDKT